MRSILSFITVIYRGCGALWKKIADATSQEVRVLFIRGRAWGTRAAVGLRHFMSTYVWVPIVTSPGLGVYDSNRVYRQLGYRVQNPIGRYLLCFAIFVMPLLAVCAWRSLLISNADIAQWASSVNLIGTNVAQAVTTLLQQRPPLTLYADIWIVIVVFGVMPIHSVLVLEIWDTIERAALQMRTDGMVSFSEETYASELARHRRMFNSRALHFAAYIGALTFTALLLSNARSGVRWWGDFRDPISSVAFTLVLIVAWYQLLWHNFKGIAALGMMRIWLSQPVLKLDLFHPDGVYGLRLVARTLTLSMLTTALHAFAVLCLVRAGFIPGGVNGVTIVIAMFFVVFFPAFAAYPVFILWRRSRAIKAQSYSGIAQRLRSARLHSSLSLEDSSLQPDAIPLAILALAVNRLPTHPFRRTATTALVMGYALQIASALLTLLPVAPASVVLR